MKSILNWIDGQPRQPENGQWLDKINPHTGSLLTKFPRSSSEDLSAALDCSARAFSNWSETPPVVRGNILYKFANLMEEMANELAAIVSIETGKPPKDANGEVGGAVQQARYFAGEGMRLYGQSLTSSMPGKTSFTVRQPKGIAGLIVPANTPIANIAWKIFPALICGNTIVLKASEDAPEIATKMAEISKDAGLPDGVLNVIHGFGHEVGAQLVNSSAVDVISFTGSTSVGAEVAKHAGERLATVSLELGGKNAFVVVDDADLEQATKWACLSIFSNAGQRCSSASRLFVMKPIYHKFKELMIEKINQLKLGVTDGCDLGPVVNHRQHTAILNIIKRAVENGGKLICGGERPSSKQLADGFYIAPTLVEGLNEDAEANQTEIFGPVATIQSFDRLQDVISIVEHSGYGLTAAIHTKDIDKAMWFAKRIRTGVVNINIGTYGSEPHMPFGGYGKSGNGTREPGLEALSVYSELKNISTLTRYEDADA